VLPASSSARIEDFKPDVGWEHAMLTVWENGRLLRDWSFAEVRARSNSSR